MNTKTLRHEDTNKKPPSAALRSSGVLSRIVSSCPRVFVFLVAVDGGQRDRPGDRGATRMLRVARWAGVGACLAMLALQIALQTFLTPARSAPWGLFIVFSFLWAFGAAMQVRAPVFGAVGTMLWGALATIGAWNMHKAATEDIALVGGSALTALLAIAHLVALRSAEARTR